MNRLRRPQREGGDGQGRIGCGAGREHAGADDLQIG